MGNNRLDLTSFTEDAKLLVEAKILDSNKSKSEIIDGFIQLLRYDHIFGDQYNFDQYVLVYFRVGEKYLD